jgi:phenolic acid decarboxylase
MYENFEDVVFCGSNIPKEVEHIVNSANDSVNASFDNDEQRAAYRLGVLNTLSALKYLLDESVSSDGIIFYYPNAETSEEMSIEDIIEWLNSLDN